MVSIIALLIMSVELINDCVVIPEPVNWKDRVKWSRRWETEIVGGVTGAEDRSTGRTAPLESLEYTITTFGVQQRARLNARLLEALMSGRACAPWWGRGQRMEDGIGENLVAGLSYPAPGVRNIAVVEGAAYAWVPGPNETELTNTGAQTIFAACTFTALGANVTVVGSPNVAITGQLRRLDLVEVATEGQWPWTEGDYAFFLRPFQAHPQEVGFENRDVLIDSGAASAELPWAPESSLVSGGANYSPGAPSIDRSLIKGWEAPPAAVYQTARNISSAPENDLSVSYSAFYGAFLVTGLEVGGRYYYVRADDDTTGCTYTDAAGQAQTLGTSGSFVSGADFCLVHCPALETPGTIHPIQAIVYTIPNLLKGVECQLRLHFAEIESGFDGSTAHRRFTIQVQGDARIETTFFEPFAVAGALNKAVAVDFTVRPDTHGQVVITLIPEPPDFCTGINAVELYQRTWEIVELASGTEENLLVWDEPLKGYYAADWLVYPVFFGKPKVQQKRALTGRHADVRLTLSEPMGSGDLGVNACPAEVCPMNPFMDLPSNPLPEWPMRELLPGEEWYQPEFEEPGGSTRPVGVDPLSGQPVEGDPLIDDGTQLYPGVLELWAAAVWAQWLEHKAAEGIIVDYEGLYWAWNPGTQLKWNANSLFGSGIYGGAAAYSWEIWVYYKVA